MIRILDKAAGTIRALAAAYQFGFMRGHAYLNEHDLQSLRQILGANDAADEGRILAAYEAGFARLVGDGAAVSFASARMAFYVLMKALGIGEGDEVILPAFTCAAMPNAVMRTGARPIYADIDRATFGSHARAIEKAVSKRTRLMVAQHSFGIPCDIREIAEMAQKLGVFLVEDCAIALDSSIHGVSVGNWGDAALFSTDHSKPLNTVIGGMLYTRNQDTLNKIATFAHDVPALEISHQKRLYEQMLCEREIGDPVRYARIQFQTRIRMWLGRLSGADRAIFFNDDLDAPDAGAAGNSYAYPARMPAFLAKLGTLELQRWQEERRLRKNVLARFLEAAEQGSAVVQVPAVYADTTRDITPLRFVFTSSERGVLLSRLDNCIDASGIWFQEPVIGSRRGPESLGYVAGSCPEAEMACATIVNLPCSIETKWALELAHKLHDAATPCSRPSA